MYTIFYSGNPKEKYYLEYLSVHVRMILKLILKEYKVWPGFLLQIGSSVELF
jgi:hypothetical protein